MCTSIQGCSSRGVTRIVVSYKEMGGNVVIGRSIYGVVVIDGLLYFYIRGCCNRWVVILLYMGLL